LLSHLLSAAAPCIPDTPRAAADILVRPVTAAGQTTSEVYLPGSEPWYDVRSFVALGGERPASVVVKSPLDKIPVFQRGGSIVPRRERARRSSALMVRDPYTLVVALDRSGKATGTLYADDGRSFDFQGGKFLHRTFRFEGDALVSKRSPGALGNGTFATGCVIERVVILGALRSYTRAQVSDAAGAVREASVVALRGRVEVRKPDLSVDADWTLSLA
jgi:alpha 1,3-glucosidase